MRSYMILAVLALAASTIPPALSAQIQYRVPRRTGDEPLNVLQMYRWTHATDDYRIGGISPGPLDPPTHGGNPTAGGNLAPGGTGTGNPAAPARSGTDTGNPAAPGHNPVGRPTGN